MIDTARELITCKYCGAPIVQKGGRGHRKRVYCNDAHKMKDRRRQSAEKQQAAATQAQAQIAALQKQVRELEKQLLAVHSGPGLKSRRDTMPRHHLDNDSLTAERIASSRRVRHEQCMSRSCIISWGTQPRI